jgi:hypothetical protein
MPIEKLPGKIAELVLDLEQQDKTPAEIAQILNLKKVQVSTILAAKKLASSELPQKEDQEEKSEDGGVVTSEPETEVTFHSARPSGTRESRAQLFPVPYKFSRRRSPGSTSLFQVRISAPTFLQIL